MYNFASSAWTEEASQKVRERLTRVSDLELQRELEAVEYMCSARATWGKAPRESYTIQREIVQEEIRKRHA